jgi:hypothetical protein
MRKMLCVAAWDGLIVSMVVLMRLLRFRRVEGSFEQSETSWSSVIEALFVPRCENAKCDCLWSSHPTVPRLALVA